MKFYEMLAGVKTYVGSETVTPVVLSADPTASTVTAGSSSYPLPAANYHLKSTQTNPLPYSLGWTATTQTLEFELERDTFSVTYTRSGTIPDTADALPVAQSGIPWGSTVTVASQPSLVPGYTFSAWTPSSTSGFTLTGTSFVMPPNNVELTGVWSANTNTPYKVEHYKVDSLGNAVCVTADTENHTGTTNTQVTATPRTDYTGYTYDETDVRELKTASILGNGELVLKLYYKANSSLISYDANTGAGTMADTEATFNESASLRPNAFTKTGYTFAGWNTAPQGGGTPYDNGHTFNPWIGTTPITLYAQWTPADGTAYQVEHHLVSSAGTTLAATENLTGTTEDTARATIQSFTGYTHDAGYAGTLLSASIAPDGSTVLKVYYRINAYTVTFMDYNSASLKTQSVEYGRAATAPASPYRIGYTFSGWDKSFGFITSDTTVRALYTINTYTVTFVDFDGSVITTLTVPYGGAALAPQSPLRTDHLFTSWDTDFSYVTSNLVVVALYEPLDTAPATETFTVRFVDFDGALLKTEQVKRGEDATAPADPARAGYTFLRWDSSFADVQANLTVTAEYVRDSVSGEDTVLPPITPEAGTPTFSIFGTDVPLFGAAGTGSWGLFNLICTILAVLLMLVSVLRFTLARRNKDDEGKERVQVRYNESAMRHKYQETVNHRRLPVLIVSGAATLVAVILFILTQDITQPMAIFDWWSLAFMAIAVLTLIAAVLVVYKKKEKDTFDQSEIRQTA